MDTIFYHVLKTIKMYKGLEDHARSKWNNLISKAIGKVIEMMPNIHTS